LPTPGIEGASMADLDPNALAVATDEALDALFLQSTTLPIETLVNTGAHRVDVARRTIFNDEHWKGWLPKGLRAGDVFARLRTGYAKRFWKKGDRYLGETRYVQGRVLVKHALEEITIHQTVNDLPPGRYIILHYTDLVFKLVFYDAMKILDDNVILYRGYAGPYPNGRRGFSGVLMRGYSFAQMGLRDHHLMFEPAPMPVPGFLAGQWRLQVIDTSDHASDLGRMSIDRRADGHLACRCEASAGDDLMPVPQFVLDHFTSGDVMALEGELRRIDDRLVLGRWTTPLSGVYAKLLLSGQRGIFHREQGKAGGRLFTMHYLLTRD
jgi:hypothetical protein